ncbi:hypothetical protein A3SI_10949 [Nitritalea halalkaliphila LW7]|uniref:Uncharacterized protein n=1 Tax=Nitritalea halalkaliphila LW7 TaxID=1189621 RepID=I5C2U5_9BACT|nr:hypothetical protein A3SI_10949 [Nitritalea halalkaliphila LW7]
MEIKDKEFYQELYREWLSSGLKKSVLAANRVINRTNLYYRCKELEVVSEPIWQAVSEMVWMKESG